MKKRCKLLLCLAAATMTAYLAPGQQRYAKPRTSVSAGMSRATTPSRWQLGGNIGFGFNNDYTNINIAPKIGYALTRGLTVGGGMNYNYYENKRYDFTENYFGMHLFASVHPIRYISIFVQPEGQRRWGTDRWGSSETEFLPCVLVGGGIVIPTGARGGMSVMVYYDVVQDPHSPYGNRIGYSVGYTFRL